MQTIIQVIETQWTKSSRGMPGAALRNLVPQVIPVPSGSSNQSVLLHHVIYYESDNFIAHESVKLEPFSPNDSKKYCVEICEVSENIKVEFFGAPDSHKSGRPVTSIILTSNSWVQILANWRSSQEYTWSYRKHVYNIFYGLRQKANQVLLQKEPIACFNHEKHLW